MTTESGIPGLRTEGRRPWKPLLHNRSIGRIREVKFAGRANMRREGGDGNRDRPYRLYFLCNFAVPRLQSKHPQLIGSDLTPLPALQLY